MNRGNGSPRRLVWRLAATYLLTTLVLLVVLGAGVYALTAYGIEQRLEAELAAQAGFYAAYAAQLAATEEALVSLAPTLVRLYAPQADLNVRLFSARSGTLLAATQDIGPQPSQAALRALRYRSPALLTRASRDLPDRRYAAQAIVAGASADRPIGVVEVSRSAWANQRALATLRLILLLALLVAAGVTLLVSVLLARRLSCPIAEMERAALRMAAGDLDVRLAGGGGDELGRLATSINQLAARLQELEETRARFIGEIAHDLRTPLAGLKGLLVNLIDAPSAGETSEAGDAPPPSETPSLELAEQETDRLIRLVNQLLDLARWQGGRLALNRSPCDLGVVSQDAVRLVEARARHRNVDLCLECASGLPSIQADPDRLERVILNLLDNALRFTPGGGRITLSIAHREAELEVSVVDTGRGMSEEEQRRAFEPYYRGPGGGAGLGLTIARAIVLAHGGRIGVESPVSPEAEGTLKGGTRVWFALPL